MYMGGISLAMDDDIGPEFKLEAIM